MGFWKIELKYGTTCVAHLGDLVTCPGNYSVGDSISGTAGIYLKTIVKMKRQSGRRTTCMHLFGSKDQLAFFA